MKPEDKIKALAKELFDKNESVAIELANIIFGIRDGDYDEPEIEKFRIPDDFMMPKVDRILLQARDERSLRISMLASCHGGLKEFVEGEENWYLYFYNETYIGDYSKYCFFPERVYMTKQVMNQVCELLNSGAYSLDGE